MLELTLDHINIATARLEQTRRFYCDVLGLTEGYRPEFSTPGYWLYAGGHPVVHLQIAAEEPQALSSVRHFAMACASVRPFLARLEAAGVRYEQTTTPDGEFDQVFFTDPSGARLELLSRRSAPR